MLSAFITTKILPLSILLNMAIAGYSQAVIISELMPNPTDTGEWIELYNDTYATYDLAGFRILDRAGSQEVLIEQHMLVPPGGFALLLYDYLTLERLNPPAETVIIINQDLPILNNDGDELVLLNAGSIVIDKMMYDSNLAKYEGTSIERIGMQGNGMDPNSWGVCVDPNGHTAGKSNSLSNVKHDKASISASPNPFNPDGDGIDETTIISFNIPAVETRITVGIYDQAGRKVRGLASNQPAGSSVPTLEWNGCDDTGRRLPIGRYIILMEALDYRNGKSFLVRCSVVLAGNL